MSEVAISSQTVPNKRTSQTRVLVKGKLVKLRARRLPKGGESLYLDYSENGKRKYDFLGLHLVDAKTSLDRQLNKDTQLAAERIRSEREILLSKNGSVVKASAQRKADFITFLEEYIETYLKKDRRIIEAMRKKFNLFIDNRETLPFSEVTPRLCSNFRAYLEKGSKGETPYNYFKKFRKVLKQAVTDGIIATNPASEIANKKTEGIKKEVLSMEEIQALAKTPCANDEVKRAFLFSCLTGLRYCDVLPLDWQSVKGSVIRLNQQKTGKEVVVNLNSTALKLLGERPKKNQPIFTLPSHTACSKNLQSWADKAELGKKITWHCARHSFGTNLLITGADIRSVSGLLGHSSLKETEKYVRLVEALKEKAVERLPEIEL